MAWRDRLRKASFKGVTFYVDASAMTKGRRVPVRKLAGKDGSVQQDLGRDPDELDLAAFFWGEDYDVARDAFEEKLCESGPGALVHPTRGDLWVRVTRGPVTAESRTEQGYCTIRFSVVVERRDGGTLRARTDTASTLKKAAKNLRTVAATDATSALSTASMPSKYLASTIAAVGSVTDSMREVQRRIQGELGVIDTVSGALDELDSTVNTLLSTPSELVTKLIAIVGDVLGLAHTVTSGIDRITGLPRLITNVFANSASARATVKAAKRIAALGSTQTAAGATTLARQEAANNQAVFRASRASALATQAETYADAAFDSAALALETLANIADEVEALSVYSPSDELFGALSDLRAAATLHLTQVAGALPQVVTYDPPQEVPALLIAFDLYGDARREAEIVARNRTPYPHLVSDPIEVLQS